MCQPTGSVCIALLLNRQTKKEFLLLIERFLDIELLQWQTLLAENRCEQLECRFIHNQFRRAGCSLFLLVWP